MYIYYLYIFELFYLIKVRKPLKTFTYTLNQIPIFFINFTLLQTNISHDYLTLTHLSVDLNCKFSSK